MQWYDNRRNLAALAAFLRNEGEVPDIVHFLAEPWLWDLEWQAFQASAQEMRTQLLEQGRVLRTRRPAPRDPRDKGQIDPPVIR